MAIVPDESRAFLGKMALAAQNLYINLYSNNETPGAGAVVGSFTKAETSIGTGPAGNSNACGTLFSGSWGGANAGSPGTYTATQVSYGGTYSWTFSASVGTIYGYAISTGTGLTGTLVGAERFSTPQHVTATGDKISVVVKLLTA